MISQLCGNLVEINSNGKITLDVNGVGYELEISLLTLCELEIMRDKQIKLFIHMVVREDAMLLFGFIRADERSIFKELIKINGIGPKVALSILSHILPGELTECIVTGNVTRLTQIPGIGKKTAERLLIEIKDKILGIELNKEYNPSEMVTKGVSQEAISGLISLGYKPNDAVKMINSIDDGSASAELLIRKALKSAAIKL